MFIKYKSKGVSEGRKGEKCHHVKALKNSSVDLTLNLRLNHTMRAQPKARAYFKNHNFTIKYLDAQVQTEGNRLK